MKHVKLIVLVLVLAAGLAGCHDYTLSSDTLRAYNKFVEGEQVVFASADSSLVFDVKQVSVGKSYEKGEIVFFFFEERTKKSILYVSLENEQEDIKLSLDITSWENEKNVYVDVRCQQHKNVGSDQVVYSQTLPDSIRVGDMALVVEGEGLLWFRTPDHTVWTRQ